MADKKEEKEIGRQCGECKKALNRAKRYYRAGDYYCNKNCYNKKIATQKAEQAKEVEEAPAV